jgi:hypothetical protein
MDDDRKIDHAMMSFALMGGMLITKRPKRKSVAELLVGWISKRNQGG